MWGDGGIDKERLLMMMLMVYNPENSTTMPVSICVSLSGLKSPRFKHTKLPAVPNKQCIAVSVYG